MLEKEPTRKVLLIVAVLLVVITIVVFSIAAIEEKSGDFLTGPNPTPQPSPSATVLSIANWKTFQSSYNENDFEIKYPAHFNIFLGELKRLKFPLDEFWITNSEKNCHIHEGFSVIALSNKTPAGLHVESKSREIGGKSLDFSYVYNEKQEPVTIAINGPVKNRAFMVDNYDSATRKFNTLDANCVNTFMQVLSTYKSITLNSSNTLNWKTYRNDEFGFEFNYPSTWKFEENSWITDHVTIPMFNFYLPETDPNTGTDKTVEFRLVKYTKEDFDLAPLNASTPNIKTVNLGGLPALELVTLDYHKLGTYKWTRIYQEAKKIEVGFLINDYTEEKNAAYSPIFIQILSTFKFTK